MAIEKSKAQYLRDLLDKALVLEVPQMGPEEFNRIFGIKVEPGEIKGMTFAEVMMRQLVLKACAGNDKSIQEVLDRLLGKPMQVSESTVKTYSYQDWLIELRNSESGKPALPNRGVVEVLPPPDDPLADLL